MLSSRCLMTAIKVLIYVLVKKKDSTLFPSATDTRKLIASFRNPSHYISKVIADHSTLMAVISYSIQVMTVVAFPYLLIILLLDHNFLLTQDLKAVALIGRWVSAKATFINRNFCSQHYKVPIFLFNMDDFNISSPKYSSIDVHSSYRTRIIIPQHMWFVLRQRTNAQFSRKQGIELMGL